MLKPLPVALLTPLDAAIWLEVDARMDGEREYALHVDARQSDRRDAALMWWAQRHPEHCEVIPASVDPADPYRIHVRAWIAPPEIESAGEWPDIT